MHKYVFKDSIFKGSMDVFSHLGIAVKRSRVPLGLWQGVRVTNIPTNIVIMAITYGAIFQAGIKRGGGIIKVDQSQSGNGSFACSAIGTP